MINYYHFNPIYILLKKCFYLLPKICKTMNFIRKVLKNKGAYISGLTDF